MKAKFYSLRSLFFIVFLLFSSAETIKAQAVALSVSNPTVGGDGTIAKGGDRLIYSIVVTGPVIMINPKVSCPVPVGTFYVPGSTTLNNTPFPDQNNTMPWATAQLIPVPGASGEVTINFEVEVAANFGNITGEAQLQTVNYPLATSNQTVTNLTIHAACGSFYTLTTNDPEGYTPNPNVPLPYRYIRSLNLTNGASSGSYYNGATGLCKNANDNSNLPAGSVLKDASAMASFSGLIYFVNKPINNQPADLCYLQYLSSNAVAYQFVGIPLTNNTTSPITRMTFDAINNGYAITDNGQEFIHFTAYYSGSPVIDNPVPLTNDPGNGVHDILAERGGDICPDGSGKLLLIPNSGNVYRIDPITKIATYLGSIAGFPAAGCNSVTIDRAGIIYIGGFYQTLFKLTLSSMILTSVNNYNMYVSGDFASCVVPLQPARVATNENATSNVNSTVQLSGEVFAKVQPNPFKKMLNVQVQLNTTEVVRVRLIDFYGRTVYARSEKLSTGS
ncbi:MAG TPA: hypothetical protein VF008_29100, partial [Niastella sp.]